MKITVYKIILWFNFDFKLSSNCKVRVQCTPCEKNIKKTKSIQNYKSVVKM